MAAETTPPPSRHVMFVIFVVFAVASTVPIFFSGYFLARTVILLRSSSGGGNINPSSSDGFPHPRLDVDLGFAIFAVVVSLMGSAAIIWRVNFKQPFAMACGITLAIVVLLLVVVTLELSSNVRKMDPLEEYPPWFRNFLLDDKDWGAFQRYIVQEQFCNKDIKGGTSIQLLVLHSGCCSPPDYCGYQEMNKTWVVPKSGQNHQEKDCMMWSNEVDKLCYNCNTCKAGYLYRYVRDWSSRVQYMLLTGPIWICCYAFIMDQKADKNCHGTAAKAPAACEP